MKNYNASCGHSWNYFEKFLYATFFFLLTEKSFNSNFKYQDDLFIKSLINTICKGHHGLDNLEAPLWPLDWLKMEDIHFSYLWIPQKLHIKIFACAGMILNFLTKSTSGSMKIQWIFFILGLHRQKLNTIGINSQN